MKLTEAREYALERLTNDVPTTHCYHNVEHTRDGVVPVALEIGRKLNLSPHDLALLETAAWFHDIGLIHTNAEHERMGCAIAASVLTQFEYTQGEIERIETMIMATKVPQAPTDLLAAILCDADLDVLGREDFRPKNERLRQEMANLGQSFSDARWYSSQWRFIIEHHYHTPPARQRRTQQKMLNAQYLLDCMLRVQREVAEIAHFAT